MEKEKIKKNLDKRYHRINKIITSRSEGRRICHSTLFKTKLGKQLGKNIDQVQEFSLKGILTIFPFDAFIQSLKHLYTNDGYLEEIRKSDKSESTQILINIITDQIIPDLESSVPNQIFNETDERIFMGTLTTALYALIDGYSIDALSLVLDIEGAPKRILRNLGSSLQFSFRDIEEIINYPEKEFRSLALEEARKKSVEDRIRLLKSGTGIWDYIHTSIKTANLIEYENHFQSFISLRHKIAHHYPIPTTRKFLRNVMIQEYVNQLKTRFRDSFDNSEFSPEIVSEVFEVLMQWFENRQVPIGIILQLTTMASIYPAIIDNAIHLMGS